MSLTHSYSDHFSITYDKDFMMLQNTCIRYDKTLKHKPSTTSKAVYQHELDEDPSIHDEEDDSLDDNFAPDGIIHLLMISTISTTPTSKELSM